VKLAVGCPIYERAWVLPSWLERLKPWSEHADLTLVFVYTPSQDATRDLIEEVDFAKTVVHTVSAGTHSTQRNWGDAGRIKTLAALRNDLLDAVTALQPDLFLSLDSDILACSWEELQILIGDLGYFDAVAPLVMLSKNGTTSNAFYQRVPGGSRRRVKTFYDVPMPVDVICAAKLMHQEVFSRMDVMYRYHPAGEDIYWSNRMHESGYSIALDPRVKMKHIMGPDQLDKVDDRVGW